MNDGWWIWNESIEQNTESNANYEINYTENFLSPTILNACAVFSTLFLFLSLCSFLPYSSSSSFGKEIRSPSSSSSPPPCSSSTLENLLPMKLLLSLRLPLSSIHTFTIGLLHFIQPDIPIKYREIASSNLFHPTQFPDLSNELVYEMKT